MANKSHITSNKRLGASFEKLIKAHGYNSLHAFHIESGIGRNAIYQFADGGNPELDTLRQIAGHLKMSLEEFFKILAKIA